MVIGLLVVVLALVCVAVWRAFVLERALLALGVVVAAGAKANELAVRFEGIKSELATVSNIKDDVAALGALIGVVHEAAKDSHAGPGLEAVAGVRGQVEALCDKIGTMHADLAAVRERRERREQAEAFAPRVVTAGHPGIASRLEVRRGRRS